MPCLWTQTAVADSSVSADRKGNAMSEVLDSAAEVEAAASDAQERNREAPHQSHSPRCLSFRR